MASLALAIGKPSVVAFTPWRAATSIISRSLFGLPIGLPVTVRIPAISGKACKETGEGGTPRKHSVPVGRNA